MLNFSLRAPEQANAELASGWVFQVPKKTCVDDPIVCGEVFLKLPARLATARLVATRSVPSSCFGSVPSLEALYILRHAAQTSELFADDTLLCTLTFPKHSIPCT